MISKRRIVVILIVVLIVVIPLIAWGISSNNNSNDKTIKDRDTGEVYDKTVNSEDTGGSDIYQGTAVLFGIENLTQTLLDNDKSVGYINSVKTALWEFSSNRLNNEFESITLRPQGLVINDSKVTGTIRLGQSDTTLPIVISPTTSGKEAIVSINKNGSQYKGEFVYIGGIRNPDNLLFTITQKNDASTDLEINTYEGYREPALEYIESLGYNVPDFTINFSNYENPFKS